MTDLTSLETTESAFSIDSSFGQVGKELLCGAIAGSCGVTLGIPFDFIKVRMQTYSHIYKSEWHCIKISLMNEGISGMFRGVSSPVLAQGFMNALLFAGESSTMRFLQPNLKHGETGDPLNVFIAGSVGGALSCLALVPCDVIKCRMQVESLESVASQQTVKFSGVLDCFNKIYHTEGFLGLYKGFGVTVMREVPSLGIYFLVYKNLRSFFTESNKSEPSTLATLFAGGLAGSASWATVYPIDVVKSNIQVTNNGKVKSMLQTSIHLIKRHGPLIFFRGFGITVARAFPVNATTFYVYEYLMKL